MTGDERQTRAYRKRRAELINLAYGHPCYYCQQTMRLGEELHADHVIPVALGGAGGPLRITHARCNISAGSRLAYALYPEKRPAFRAAQHIREKRQAAEGEKPKKPRPRRGKDRLSRDWLPEPRSRDW